MAKRFDGLTDIQWKILEPLIPKNPDKRGKVKPHTLFKKVRITIFWIMITKVSMGRFTSREKVGIALNISPLARNMAS